MAPNEEGVSGRHPEEEVEAGVKTGEDTVSTGTEVSQGATSPEDVLEHLGKITVGLEQAWSEALASKDSRKAIAEARGVWNSFTATHERWTAHFVELWRQCGLDELVIEEFPLGDEGLLRLSKAPGGVAERFYRLQIATMYTFLDLVDALKGLEGPSGLRVNMLPGQPSESWWEAGAFALIRRRSVALAKLLRESEACLKEVVLESGAGYAPFGSESVRRIWEQPLRTASGLVEQGWHEAALPQLLMATRAVLAEALSVDPSGLPAPLATPSQGIETISSIAPHLPLLEACCERIGKGLSVDPCVAVPLAKELLLRIQRLACNPPPAGDLMPLKESRSE